MSMLGFRRLARPISLILLGSDRLVGANDRASTEGIECVGAKTSPFLSQ